MDIVTIPIFPLRAVLFPEGKLPLRIFEPRYLDMVSNCFKSNEGFGVCLIREGSEVGKAAETYETGTLTEITYFNKHADGMLGITASGKQRFNIISKEVREVLKRLLNQLGYPFLKIEKRYDDASWVSSRLSELLPIRLEQKQYFLQLDDPVQRLERLWFLLEELDLR